MVSIRALTIELPRSSGTSADRRDGRLLPSWRSHHMRPTGEDSLESSRTETCPRALEPTKSDPPALVIWPKVFSSIRSCGSPRFKWLAMLVNKTSSLVS
jgi:hypothetical protein